MLRAIVLAWPWPGIWLGIGLVPGAAIRLSLRELVG
jgi:hypothetical protein